MKRILGGIVLVLCLGSVASAQVIFAPEQRVNPYGDVDAAHARAMELLRVLSGRVLVRTEWGAYILPGASPSPEYGIAPQASDPLNFTKGDLLPEPHTKIPIEIPRQLLPALNGSGSEPADGAKRGEIIIKPYKPAPRPELAHAR
jgi:hypothetical protein